ncbi:preprotein translocase subunit TatC [Candidatus Saccharibacteria bacterium]|nr:MAG: preprotein translocase subunit TatC [Candidatus Saccharibacteria bacterium]
MKRTKRKPAAKLAKASRPVSTKAPLSEHLRELKRRLIYVAVSIVVWSAAAYGVERQLIDIFLRPSHGQEFVYTSPMGGVNFLFSVCLFVGIAMSVPVIVYNALKFLLPLMKRTTMRFIYICSTVSALLALAGILFGYFFGLPAALHFLLRQQFHNGQVEAMITIQSYFSFVTAYMVGAAIMFQLPLILVIINRIKPLKPRQMFKAERAVILFAFIAAFIMNPTPNVIDQLLVVIPIILTYQLGIGIVWLINRNNKHVRYQKLFEQDAAKQGERERQREAAQPLAVFTASTSSALSPLVPQLELVPVPASGPDPTTHEAPAQTVTEPVAAPGQRIYSRQPVPSLSRSNYIQ